MLPVLNKVELFIYLFFYYFFHRLFKQKVSQSRSSVKISDQVDRNSPKLIEAVFWSSLLDNVFKENLKNDPELRYVNCMGDW